MDTSDPLPTDARIGRMVRALLDLMGLERQELAHRIGMRPGTLGNKLSGERPWKASELDQVSAALHVPRPLLDRDPDAVLSDLSGPFTNYRSA